MISVMEFLKEILKPYKKEIILITVIAILASILSTLIPFIYGRLFDLAIKDTPTNILFSLIFIWLFTSLISNYIQNKPGAGKLKPMGIL